MRILRLAVPGRFPTVVHDPGRWPEAAAGRHEILHFSLNYSWWRIISSPAVKALMLASLTPAQKLRRRLEWRAQGIDLAASAERAWGALDRFLAADTYRRAQSYLDAVGALVDHVETLNRVQNAFHLSLEHGPEVTGLDYGDSAALVGYALRDTLLARLIDAVLEECPGDIGMLILAVTSPQELLTALIATRLLRERNPAMHACLADHGYENFSLHPHLERLRGAGTLEGVFDTIIESKDERDSILPALIGRVAQGDPPKGYLGAESLAGEIREASASPLPVPPLPTFASEPILWTRLSKRRCYWSRCTFCAQNAKYDDPSPPARSEIDATLDRVEANIRAGHANFIFSDETVSPAFLDRLCEGIGARGLSFLWNCRCKLDPAHTPELFGKMREAGCYEVLFGLESISPRVQKLMGKHVEGLDRRAIAGIIRAAAAAGLGPHVNIIGGFPGETAEEMRDTADFLIETLADLDGATYLISRFALFPDTPILANPGDFGVIPFEAPGDMPFDYGFALAPEIIDGTTAAVESIPQLQERLDAGLGWDRLGAGAGARAAQALYFHSGHGAILKALSGNPLANPLRALKCEVS